MQRPLTQHAEKLVPLTSSSLHILIVEDYAPSILVTTTYLELCGHSFDVAQSAEEAVQKAKICEYSVILMDVKLKGMNGLEATHHIRAFEQENNRKPVPIIGVTAMAMMGDMEQCFAAGMNDYISKPVNYSDLEKKIQKLSTKNS